MPQDDVVESAKKAARDAGEYVGNIDTLRRIGRVVSGAEHGERPVAKPSSPTPREQPRMKPVAQLRKRQAARRVAGR